MTDIATIYMLPQDEIEAHIVAGRRAAWGAILTMAREMPNAVPSGDTEEQYSGGHIKINGMDIGPAIDEAVRETIARCQWKVVLSAKRRPWWKVWA